MRNIHRERVKNKTRIKMNERKKERKIIETWNANLNYSNFLIINKYIYLKIELLNKAWILYLIYVFRTRLSQNKKRERKKINLFKINEIIYKLKDVFCKLIGKKRKENYFNS
jgi:hypothetical protein